MKKSMILLGMFLTLGLSLPVIAADTSATDTTTNAAPASPSGTDTTGMGTSDTSGAQSVTPTTSSSTSMTKENPCKSIVQACKDAGYEKHASKNGDMRLWKNCIRPIIKGHQDQTKVTTSIDSADVKACSAHMKHNLQKKLNELNELSKK